MSKQNNSDHDLLIRLDTKLDVIDSKLSSHLQEHSVIRGNIIKSFIASFFSILCSVVVYFFKK